MAGQSIRQGPDSDSLRRPCSGSGNCLQRVKVWKYWYDMDWLNWWTTTETSVYQCQHTPLIIYQCQHTTLIIDQWLCFEKKRDVCGLLRLFRTLVWLSLSMKLFVCKSQVIYKWPVWGRWPTAQSSWPAGLPRQKSRFGFEFFKYTSWNLHWFCREYKIVACVGMRICSIISPTHTSGSLAVW